jgi:hypothetical protein
MSKIFKNSVNTKIIARIFGGIGNQLFCYAAARRMALVNNSELLLDHVSGFVHDVEYQRHYQLDHFNIPCRKATPPERLEPMSRVRRYLIRAMSFRQPFEERSYIQQQEIDFESRLLTFKPYGTVYLEGYWQSEQYFKDVEPVIRKELLIVAPRDEVNQAMAEQISRCIAVAVHVRFFDAPEEQGLNNAPSGYYERAVTTMESLAPGAHYFVFSDQPAAARDKIQLPDDRITLVSHNQGDENAYADLWLMTQCQHFIIANSTFSWWGAWLSTKDDKKVIAPELKLKGKQTVTSWGFKGLLPECWILK